MTKKLLLLAAILLFYKCSYGNITAFQGPKSTQKDSTGLYIYSFEQQKTIKYSAIKTNENISLLSTCEGYAVVLSAPDYGQNAQYLWQGPNGIISNKKDFLLNATSLKQAGLYNLTIKKNEQTVFGKVKLIVNAKPQLQLPEQWIFTENDIVSLKANIGEAEASIQWLSAQNEVLSTENELMLSSHPIGKYTYYLSAEKNGCRNVKEAVVMVKANTKKERFGFSN